MKELTNEYDIIKKSFRDKFLSEIQDFMLNRNEYCFDTMLKVNTWNRVFDFFVTKLFFSSKDNKLLIEGEYNGFKSCYEQLSNVDIDGLINIYEHLKNN